MGGHDREGWGALLPSGSRGGQEAALRSVASQLLPQTPSDQAGSRGLELEKLDVLRARGQVGGPVSLSFPTCTSTLVPQAAPGPDQGRP